MTRKREWTLCTGQLEDLSGHSGGRGYDMHMCTGLSWHSTRSDGRPCFLYLSLYFPFIVITSLYAWGTHSIRSDGDRASFTRGKASGKWLRPFTGDKKLSCFSTPPHVFVALFVKKQKGNCMFTTPWLFPLELFISCFYSLRSCQRLVFVYSVDSLACIFYPFIVFRSFVVRRLLPNAGTRQWPATPVLLRPWVAPPLDSPTGRLRQWCNRGTYCSEVGT